MLTRDMKGGNEALHPYVHLSFGLLRSASQQWKTPPLLWFRSLQGGHSITLRCYSNAWNVWQFIIVLTINLGLEYFKVGSNLVTENIHFVIYLARSIWNTWRIFNKIFITFHQVYQFQDIFCALLWELAENLAFNAIWEKDILFFLYKTQR